MTEIQRINALLPTELFEDSKDWREGSVSERVEWLLSMYQSSHEDVLRLEQDVDDLKMGRYYPAEEFDK
jgi:hypothetical protein